MAILIFSPGFKRERGREGGERRRGRERRGGKGRGDNLHQVTSFIVKIKGMLIRLQLMESQSDHY